MNLAFAIAFSLPLLVSAGVAQEPDTPETAGVQDDFGDLAREDCTDRIQTIREESGQLRLERQPASPGDPLLIYAVDRREDGCPVLVMAHRPEDIRPVPDASDRPRLFPAD